MSHDVLTRISYDVASMPIPVDVCTCPHAWLISIEFVWTHWLERVCGGWACEEPSSGHVHVPQKSAEICRDIGLTVAKLHC